MESTAPLRITASLMLIPAALTSMRTSPICGMGRGRSRTSRHVDIPVRIELHCPWHGNFSSEILQSE